MSLPESDHLSVAEIRAAIKAMTGADRRRLEKSAMFHSLPTEHEPADLLQEAMERAWAGKRRCPRTVDVFYFLREAMRSIASAWRETHKGRGECRLASRHASENAPVELDLQTPLSDPEATLASEQAAEQIINRVLCLFEDDPIAQGLIKGIIEELDAQELRVATGLDKTAYDSKRRLIRRRIEKAYSRVRKV